MNRHDYTFPFRIDAASNQAGQSAYADHVDQMIRQVLLTDPGERVDLPSFGCGLRRLIFAPNSDAMQATTKILVTQQLSQWLSDQVQVSDVAVLTPDPTDGGSGVDPQAEFILRIDYVLIETRTSKSTEVQVIGNGV